MFHICIFHVKYIQGCYRQVCYYPIEKHKKIGRHLLISLLNVLSLDELQNLHSGHFYNLWLILKYFCSLRMLLLFYY